MSSFYKVEGGFLRLHVKAVPGSYNTAISEVFGGKLKIRVASAPEDGKANEELRSFLAKTLNVPKRDIVIESGEKSRIKILRLPASTKEFLDKI